MDFSASDIVQGTHAGVRESRPWYRFLSINLFSEELERPTTHVAISHQDHHWRFHSGRCSGSNLPFAATGCSSLRVERGWCRSDPRLSLHTHCSCGQSAPRNSANPKLAVQWPPRFGETNTTSTSMCMPTTQAATPNARCGMSDYKSHEQQEEPTKRHSNRTWHVIVTKNKRRATGAFNEGMNREDPDRVDIMYNYCSALQQGASKISKA